MFTLLYEGCLHFHAALLGRQMGGGREGQCPPRIIDGFIDSSALITGGFLSCQGGREAVLLIDQSSDPNGSLHLAG